MISPIRFGTVMYFKNVDDGIVKDMARNMVDDTSLSSRKKVFYMQGFSEAFVVNGEDDINAAMNAWSLRQKYMKENNTSAAEKMNTALAWFLHKRAGIDVSFSTIEANSKKCELKLIEENPFAPPGAC